MLKYSGIALLFLFCSLNIFGQQNDDAILDKTLGVKIENESIEVALDLISKIHKVYFSYDPTLINVERKITLQVNDVSIKRLLELIFGDDYEFEVMQDQIIIKKKKKSQQRELTSKPKVPEIIRLSGLIRDLETSQPIPFASISVEDMPLGTISNADGEFELKIPYDDRNKVLLFSCLGYKRYLLPVSDFKLESNNIFLRLVSVKIKEIKVKAIDADDIMQGMRDSIQINYSNERFLMNAFYRESLMQDDHYLDVSEAVMNILKAPYNKEFTDDKVKFLKGRKKPFFNSSKWVDFKIQGGPYYIVQLDLVKTMGAFMVPEDQDKYKYKLEEVILYNDRPTFLINFKPDANSDFDSYTGNLFIDRETFALVRADFELSRQGLKYAKNMLIRKKPKSYRVRPIDVHYRIEYKNIHEKWVFNTAHIDAAFKLKSRKQNIKSIFRSVSDLLISDFQKSNINRFKASETFHSKDIFSEKIIDYDEDFWDDFNIIKPTESLIKAFKQDENNGFMILNETTE